ncbi:MULTISPECIES: FecR domain-containing protein [unclassified Ruegeria]|uniref:FecR family protein n=1 Tax=unclassified Ruegeria TaxID=2625375 RepID=UPI001FFDFE66|nr:MULTISPECIES: FecR domain-containing protein [unclassified Ruegeria]
MEVESGDAITTDQNGLVQLIFVDETKIAIGPNASMVLDVTMLRGKQKAKSFAVQALGGSFRFISGKSKKRAYSIQTPTATMAVRGTTFDMWVVPGTQSAMLVLDGTVRMCGLGGTCRSTGRQCSLFATTQRGNVGRPIDQEQYELALKAGFPFVQSQDELLSPLKVGIGGCAAESVPLPPIKSDAPTPRRIRQQAKITAAPPAGDPPAAPEPRAPEPPAPEPPAPEPPAPEPPAPEPPAPEPPAPEPSDPKSRSGQADGSNPAGRGGPSGGVNNPGQGKGPGHGKGQGRGKGKRDRGDA